MGNDQLFSELSKPDIMKVGWQLAHGDSRDDFVRDPVSHADYAFNLPSRLEFLIEQIRSHRYRPSYLIEVDVPKSGLSVRPGNVLPIEEASILHAATYLLAPRLDKKLDSSVYSYRLHPKWKKKATQGRSLFQEVDVPFLNKKIIQSVSPFEAWYERWPAFENDARQAYLSGEYTHLTKTDIFSFFEHIDLQRLHDLLQSLLKTREEKLLQLIFTILSGWTRVSNAGMPINRGIPQGNDVSSFLGNIFLIPLDQALSKFCRKRGGRWFRYVDDVKVYTNSEQHAKEVIYEINKVLRQMHLNLQGGKTEILSGTELAKEHDNTKIDKVNEVFANISSKKNSDKKITKELKKISPYFSSFTRGLPNSVRNLEGKENKLFRRLLATYGIAGRSRKGLNDTVYAAIRELPDIRVLRSCLNYLGKQEIKNHGETVERLLDIVEGGELPFPYQVASVLEAMVRLHPDKSSRSVASRVRAYALGRNLNKGSDWFVVQKALEVIAVYPYTEKYITKICLHYANHEHPMVRRAAIMLLPRAPKDEARKYLMQFGHHPDPGVSRLAQYLLQFCSDKDYVISELSKIKKNRPPDNALIRRVYQLYAASATEIEDIAKEVFGIATILNKSVSPNIRWHQDQIRRRTDWSISGGVIGGASK